MGYISQNIDSRIVTIEGSLKASNATELESIMGAIKQKLYEPNKPMFIKRAS